jgi:cyclopropane-fatty-acyl-phospholipid synthase
MKRYLGLAFETLFFGLHLGRFKYCTRSSRPIEPERIWELFATTSHGLRWLEDLYPTTLQMRALVGLNALSMRFRDHQSGISAHYDVSNEFFGLFLDKKLRFYSAAEFEDPKDTLEDAQERKAQRWLSLIDPKPGERILDAGSGWGGMLNLVNKAVGGKGDLVGYTLSQEQKRFTEETYGLKVELRDFITTDYEEASFDKIYGIETFEHTRRREMPQFARKLRRALKPTGRLIFQSSCMPHELPPPSALFVGFDTFPGTEGSTLEHFRRSFEQASFRCRQLELVDYRPTLRAWFTRLGSQQDAAVALVGVQNYLRYLCYLASAWRLFDEYQILVARLVLDPV